MKHFYLSLFWMAAMTAVTAKQTHEIQPDLELLITSPRVVDSPAAQYPGDWSFGKLIERNFGKKLAPSVVRSWLLSFDLPQKVNGHAVPPRGEVRNRLITPWQQADGFTAGNSLEWIPDLKNAPFRLLAIVNRTDIGLSSGSGAALQYYGDSSAGEVRFVYGVTDQSGVPLTGGMTIILEFGSGFMGGRLSVRNLAERTQRLMHELAIEWHHLSRNQTIDQTYLKELAQLTNILTTPLFSKRPLTPCGQKPLGDNYAEYKSADFKVGGSSGRLLETSTTARSQALLRIRTNDNALGNGREFRQFDVSPYGILPAALSASPAAMFYKEGSKENDILLKKAHFTGGPLFPGKVEIKGKKIGVLAGHTLISPGEEKTFWTAPGVTAENRRKISLNTCMGCHCAETETEGFHIGPRLSQVPPLLSEFLASTEKKRKTKDPVFNVSYRQKGELARRVAIQDALLKKWNIRNKRFQKLVSDQNLAAH